MDRNDVVEECALKLELLAANAGGAAKRATSRDEIQRYEERCIALLDGATSLRNHLKQ